MATGWGRQSWGISVDTSTPPSSDTNPPQIINITPAQGVGRTPSQPIQFDVVDDVSLRRVQIEANFTDNLPTEVIWNGTTFLFPYLSSTKSDLVAGLSVRFIILRSGGWPTDTLHVTAHAIDSSANEA